MDIKKLDLNLLVVFEAIYDCKNISRAAEFLDLSQPATSNALRRLREQTDDKLFKRSGNGVEPTTRANDMIGPIRTALSLIRTSNSQTEFDVKTHERRFQLIIADPLEPLFLPTILTHMQNTNLSVALHSASGTNIEDALLSGQLDMADFLNASRYAWVVYDEAVSC